MTNNYEVIDSFNDIEYVNSVLIYNSLLDFEIWDIEIQHDFDKQELEFYQKYIDSKIEDDEQEKEILMIIPVKHEVLHIELWVAFDFEIVINDRRLMLANKLKSYSIAIKNVQTKMELRYLLRSTLICTW